MWRVDLICCGRDEGHVVRQTWFEADEFRNSYIDAEGHDRQGVVRQDTLHDGACNGWVTWGQPCLLDEIPDTVDGVLSGRG